MEYKSRPSKTSKSSKKRIESGVSVFEEIITNYAGIKAQVYGTDQPLDPTQLQVGQSVFNDAGEEFTVAEDPEGTTSKVLMSMNPDDPGTPQIQTIEDSELASSYNIQQGTQMAETAEKRSQYEENSEVVDWDDVQSIAIDIRAYASKKDMLGLTTAVEELTNVILSHMELPEGLDMPPMVGKARMATKIARNLKRSKGSQRKTNGVSSDVLPEFVNTPDTNSKNSSKFKDKFKGILPEFKNVKFSKKNTRNTRNTVTTRRRAFHEPVTHEDGFKSEFKEVGPVGVPGEMGPSESLDLIGPSGPNDNDMIGFRTIMEEVEEMVDGGFEVVDVILNIGEKFPREEGEKVLEAARSKGIL